MGYQITNLRDEKGKRRRRDEGGETMDEEGDGKEGKNGGNERKLEMAG